ncbi:MAG: AraC family transcriptional regulator [Spirochaetaceae bacterium]
MNKDKTELFYPKLNRKISYGLRLDKANENRNLIFRINKYISENIASDLSVTKIADEFYFNSPYLSRRYKLLTGIKLSVYIKDAKIRRSKELLQNTHILVNHNS